MSADALLRQVPTAYAMLGDHLTPGNGGGYDRDRVTGSRPEHQAPARLDVVDLRHKLVRGLRWWVDAVTDTLPTVAVADSPARMCAILLDSLQVMAPEDVSELAANLCEWRDAALEFTGWLELPAPRLPRKALDQVVPVHVAAKALGVSVSTVKRRAPREGGMVKLADAAGPLCEASDLPALWCAHCRPGGTGVRTETAGFA